MAWDSSRPVPWQRLTKEWLVYVGIMAVLFLVFFREDGLAGIFAGLLVSGPLFLLFGYAMAKLGYQRKSLKQLREEPRTPKSKRSASSDGSADRPRPKPAPTRRTGGGRPGGQRSKRRR